MGTQRSKVRQALLAVAVVVAVGAASSPFWLFSSDAQDSLAPEVTEKIADILSLGKDAQTAAADTTQGTSPTAPVTQDFTPQTASATEVQAPASSQGEHSTPPAVAATTTTTANKEATD